MAPRRHAVFSRYVPPGAALSGRQQNLGGNRSAAARKPSQNGATHFVELLAGDIGDGRLELELGRGRGLRTVTGFHGNGLARRGLSGQRTGGGRARGLRSVRGAVILAAYGGTDHRCGTRFRKRCGDAVEDSPWFHREGLLQKQFARAMGDLQPCSRADRRLFLPVAPL